MSSGVLIQTPLYATPPISSVGLSTVLLDNQLFLLTAVEGTDTPSLLLALGNWIEGADFFQRRGTLWYGVGQSSHTLLVQIYPDTIQENNRRVRTVQTRLSEWLRPGNGVRVIESSDNWIAELSYM